MGNQTGTLVGESLSKKDIERIQRRFVRMTDNKGEAQISQFRQMPELAGNPFIPRIFSLFDENRDGSINAQEFNKAVQCLANLHDVDEKFKFAFRIYDLDGNGFISSRELLQVLQDVVGSSVSPAQLQQIVTATMSEYDKDGDEALSFQEFKALLATTDVPAKFQV